MTQSKTNKMVSFTKVQNIEDQPNNNILNKLKKIDTVFKDENQYSSRINNIEDNMKQINDKIEIILTILKNNIK
jgi:hypothetical protein